MQFVNSSPFASDYTMAVDKAGRERVVVVAKGTYAIPSLANQAPSLLAEQVPLVTGDVFGGEPGASAVVNENDFAAVKPRCDVLLNGSCYAPSGRTATQVMVALRVGELTKSFRVTGRRHYRSGLLTTTLSAPEPFSVLKLGYELAYGGVDRDSADPASHAWYPLNHVGVGFYPNADGNSLRDKPAACTEELEQSANRPNGRYKPMAFGPVGRAWQQRIRWAGTYDQKWLDEQFPFLPLDFDDRYFQSAPEDQQIDYPRGGDSVALLNLTPQGRTLFKLPPDLRLPVLFLGRDDSLTEVAAVVDTLLLEPDDGRFMLVWRASIPLRRNIREIAEVRVGQSAAQLERQREHQLRMRGKRRFLSLAEAVNWKTEMRRVASRRT